MSHIISGTVISVDIYELSSKYVTIIRFYGSLFIKKLVGNRLELLSYVSIPTTYSDELAESKVKRSML